MWASELISRLDDLMALYGDLEVMYDCDAMLSEMDSIKFFCAPYMEHPILLVEPPHESKPPQPLRDLGRQNAGSQLCARGHSTRGAEFRHEQGTVRI